MVQGINQVKCCGVNVTDYTQIYNFDYYLRYIQKALTYVPIEHLQYVENINIYDNCPSNFPIIASGGYYPPTQKNGATLDIYLNQTFGHMLSFHKKRNSITNFLDGIFVYTFGHCFMINTIFHELGHHIYYMSSTSEDKNNGTASEQYANEYSINLYNKIHPLAKKYYWLSNKLYHIIYWRRIRHDTNQRKSVEQKHLSKLR